MVHSRQSRICFLWGWYGRLKSLTSGRTFAVNLLPLKQFGPTVGPPECLSWTWLCPPTYYLLNIFVADPVSLRVCVSVAFRALSSEPVDGFDQACIDTLLGGGNELIRFGWPWPNFQGHSGTLKCLKYGFCVLSSELNAVFWPTLPRYIIGSRGRVDYFGDHYLIFKVTPA